MAEETLDFVEEPQIDFRPVEETADETLARWKSLDRYPDLPELERQKRIRRDYLRSKQENIATEAEGSSAFSQGLDEALSEPLISPEKLTPRNPLYPSQPGSFRRGIEEGIGETLSSMTVPKIGAAIAVTPIAPEVMLPLFGYQGAKELLRKTPPAETAADVGKETIRVLTALGMLTGGMKGITSPSALLRMPLSAREAARIPEIKTEPMPSESGVSESTLDRLAEEAPVKSLETPKIDLVPETNPLVKAKAELRLEGVTNEDADALLAGTKTVKEVVGGNFKVTPSRVVGAEQGHDEAFAEGYNQAIQRLGDIVDQVKPKPEQKGGELPNVQKEKGQEEGQVLTPTVAGEPSVPPSETPKWSVTQDGEPYGVFSNEKQAKMVASGLGGTVEIKPVTEVGAAAEISLVDEGKVVPLVLESQPAMSPAKASQEFDRLLLQHGYELGWVHNPDAMSVDVGKAGDTASIEAKLIKSKAMQQTRRNVAAEMGINPDEVSTVAGRAKLLERLKQHIQERTQPDTLEVPEDVSTEFLPPEEAPAAPKLRAGEKKTGDLFQGEDQPFNLASEKATDFERIQKEKADAERRAAEAKSIQAKQQPGLPLGITPPGMAQAAETFTRLKTAIKSILAPASVDAAAGQAARIIRERGANMYREWIQAREALKSAKAMFDKQDPVSNLDFIDRMETGRAQISPDQQRISQQLRDALADRVRRVRALGTGRLQQVIQNYFPHIWKDPNKATAIYQSLFGKRPFEGPKAFLKQRSIPTTAEGIRAGLEPVSYNPVELTMLKLHEMDRYIMAHEVLNEMKDVGLAKFVRFGQKAPDGYGKIDDKIAQVIQMRPTTLVSGAQGAPEAILRGNYFAPEAATRVLNNYLSPGLRGNIIYNAVRGMGNALNQAQLGISAYHLTFTGIDSATSKVALGVEQIAQGKFLSGALNIAKGTIGNAALYAPIENYIKGSKVLREYTKPGSVGGELTAIVDSLIKAGGRVEMDTFYKNSSVESFWKAFREKTPEGYGKAIWRAPWALLEYASKPVMEIWVPRMKLGIFYDFARNELERMPNATPDEIRSAMAKAWDSVDNRMGQMVYDNLFWNKTLKDLSMVGVRSVGWNLGTLRELGGGLLDTAKIMERINNNDPVVTHRMAYLIALPLTVGVMGAMYQYLATGKGPETLEDYFLPKNGQKRADGSDERILLPSYMKDVLPLVKAGQEKGGWGVVGRAERMAINKANPWISVVGDMLTNKDFFGRPIANANDPLVKQVMAYAEFLRQQFKPFSFRAIQKQGGESIPAKVESFMGFQPAPAELAPTAVRDVQQKVHKFLSSQGKPEQGREPLSEYYELRQALSTGDDKKAFQELAKLRQSKSDAQILKSWRNSINHPFTGSAAMEVKFRRSLSDEDRKLYQAARDEKREMYRRFITLWSQRGPKK